MILRSTFAATGDENKYINVLYKFGTERRSNLSIIRLFFMIAKRFAWLLYRHLLAGHVSRPRQSLFFGLAESDVLQSVLRAPSISSPSLFVINVSAASHRSRHFAYTTEPVETRWLRRSTGCRPSRVGDTGWQVL